MNQLERLREDLAKLIEARIVDYDLGSGMLVGCKKVEAEECANSIRAHDLTPYTAPVEDEEVTELTLRLQATTKHIRAAYGRKLSVDADYIDAGIALMARQVAELREARKDAERWKYADANWHRMIDLAQTTYSGVSNLHMWGQAINREIDATLTGGNKIDSGRDGK